MMALLLALVVLNQLNQHHGVIFHYPRWSPDGNWLVMTSNIDGDEEVWIVSSDGKDKRKLTDNAVPDTNADWDQDGRRIIFERHAADGVTRLTMNVDGTQVREAGARVPRVIAGLIVEERPTADRQAIVVNEKGQGERKISEVRWAEQPSVSPDARFVVFEQRDNPHDVLSSNIAIWDVRRGSLRVFARWDGSIVDARRTRHRFQNASPTEQCAVHSDRRRRDGRDSFPRTWCASSCLAGR